ncbi:MAG: ANTAR domain-containing protein [Ruminiclostridium sp.]|nr:ANTAR domain-containing protein [Ruminiclostridium sp.]
MQMTAYDRPLRLGGAEWCIRDSNKEKQQLKRQIDDIRIIDRAKACLMQYLNLTEGQAHRHLQKQAMDLRKTQREAAEDVLGTYDNQN